MYKILKIQFDVTFVTPSEDLTRRTKSRPQWPYNSCMYLKSIFPFILLILAFSFGVSANTNQLRTLEAENAKMKLDMKTTQDQRDLYRNTLETFRDNDRITIEIKELEHQKEIEQVKAEYERKLAERDQILLDQNKEINQLKASKYKPIRVEYTGGEGLKKWTLPNRKTQKAN